MKSCHDGIDGVHFERQDHEQGLSITDLIGWLSSLPMDLSLQNVVICKMSAQGCGYQNLSDPVDVVLTHHTWTYVPVCAFS